VNLAPSRSFSTKGSSVKRKVTHLAEEAADLSPALGALSLNLGTLTDDQVAGMMAAGKARVIVFFGLAHAGRSGRLANLNCKPIIFDPVGCGATELRRRVTKGQSKRFCCPLPLSFLMDTSQNY
jgi:hypothetical protein